MAERRRDSRHHAPRQGSRGWARYGAGILTESAYVLALAALALALAALALAVFR